MARYFFRSLKYSAFFLLIGSLTLGAQATAPNLNDPETLLLAARATNGLTGDDLKPWHLKASYDLFDDDGKPLAKGEFEEWWVAKDRWKRSYTGDHYTGKVYRSSSGLAQEGSGLPWPERLMIEPLIEPFPEDFLKNEQVFPPKLHQEVNPPISCIDVIPKKPAGTQSTPQSMYCFEVGKTELRSKNSRFVMSVYNQLGKFQGRTVGIEIFIYVNGHALTRLHIDSLVTDATMQDSILTPPPSLISSPVYQPGMSPEITPPKLLSSTDPVFSSIPEHQQGVVVVSIVVDKKGKVTDVHVLEAPTPAMAASALESIRTYRFKPAEQGGQPVTAQVNVQVNFRR